MSTRSIYVCSDHHIGDTRISNYLDCNGKKNRPFDTLDEMHQFIIDAHNSIVTPIDKVYFLGDVIINKQYFDILSQMNGHKRLVRGNHDIYDDKHYRQYFKSIHGVKVIADKKIMMTHIPIFPNCIKNEWVNIHGHLHTHSIADNRYKNVCLEVIDYKPVNIESLI
jgi:calcineurin-like phosphoesterase family protein